MINLFILGLCSLKEEDSKEDIDLDKVTNESDDNIGLKTKKMTKKMDLKPVLKKVIILIVAILILCQMNLNVLLFQIVVLAKKGSVLLT